MYPSQKVLRKMGMLSDQDGILYRYLHEKQNWDEHLTNTRNFIKEQITPDANKKIAVLGSGWLLDVPVDFLRKNFKEVTCYDVRHPKKILAKYNDARNVKFVEMDLTFGLIERVYQQCSLWRKPAKGTFLKTMNPPQVSLPEEADIIISVNVLNQLDILLVDYISKYYRLETTELHTIRYNIQQAHITLLQAYDWCIITDYEEMRRNRQGQKQGTLNLLHCQLPEGKQSTRWVWKFDTQKTYNPKWETHMNVIAIRK